MGTVDDESTAPAPRDITDNERVFGCGFTDVVGVSKVHLGHRSADCTGSEVLGEVLTGEATVLVDAAKDILICFLHRDDKAPESVGVQRRELSNRLLVPTIISIPVERFLIGVFVAGEAGDRHTDPIGEDLIRGCARLLTDVVERVSDEFAVFGFQECRHGDG
ncbi:hypothetical protein DP107_18515 [Haloglomus irregulare]|uniref:Uncharacterized protein n=1 Tax=Haloglomus irregulare TaxID=2234134 RepID=A0A554MUB1_9EURY|nr:hypothetical protein [Haloglomus irregulare]TSD08716.1 hypothetical protein DP107_18515 [Haloglomus irregulare]